MTKENLWDQKSEYLSLKNRELEEVCITQVDHTRKIYKELKDKDMIVQKLEGDLYKLASSYKENEGESKKME